MTQVFDVIVIGCGGAGIAAISRLVQNGVNVLGLEASSRLGGRIRTVEYGENVVDLGAQWCHGEKNNAVYSLIKDLDVVSPPSDRRKFTFLRSDGDVTNNRNTEQFMKILSQIMARGKSTSHKASYPICAYLKEEFKKALEEMKLDDDAELSEHILNWYIRSTQSKISANELLERSINSLEESWDNDGEQWLNWRDKGYQTIIDVLLNAYPDKSKQLNVNVEFNKEVTNIKWSHSLKMVDSGNSVVQIQCRDGSLYTARYAIVTIPLGVLKLGHEQLFTPAIPDDKLMAIRSLAMCTMNKIYMRFSKPWWPKNPMHFALIWNEEDRGEFVDEDDWLTGVYEISTIERQPNLLCAWVVGTEAENMELCSSEDVTNGLYRLMKHFFRGYDDIERPIDILRSTWYTNSLTRGSFSYRSVETECVGGGASVLSEPLKNSSGSPVVCFAGEATSLHHHGSAHGAIESGFREANRLLSLIKS